MKSPLIMTAIILFVFVSIASAQLRVFEGSSSAGVIGDTVMFNCDLYDPIGIPEVGIDLHYKGAGDDDYITAEMEMMLDFPYYGGTFKHEVIFSESPDLLNFYFSAGTDSFKATQSPENVSNDFPPSDNLYAPFNLDPIGDAYDPLGDWLDITATGMCFSDTRVYGYIENVPGQWPNNQVLDFFVYGLGFVPYDIEDTTVWGMVYANIPFVITPGLYKLSLADTSFIRLGDIDYQIDSNGRLHMACDIADFENDPEWPGWPDDGFLLSAGVTATIGLTSQALNDFTWPTVFEPKTQYLDFGSNTAPEITGYFLDIEPGVTVTPTAFYYDADNNLPMTRLLFFNWGFYEMGSFDHTYSDTADFMATLDWPAEGWQYYHFQFGDGVNMVETPTDSIYLTPIGIDDGENLPGHILLNQNYPNPFNSTTTISFEIDKPAYVNLTIYDILGRPVTELVNGKAYTGAHSVAWDGTNAHGDTVSSGLYFFKFTAGDESIIRKMNLIK